MVIVHGAGSAQESHYDFARAAIALGFAALTFDQRGHGDSEGCFDGRGVSDVITMAELLRACLDRGLDDDQFYVGIIQPYELIEEEEIDPRYPLPHGG